jgi:hypothetical protein
MGFDHTKAKERKSFKQKTGGTDNHETLQSNHRYGHVGAGSQPCSESELGQ